MKNVQGIDTVDVSLNKGLAVIKMKPGNTVTVKQMHDAITKNGFTTKKTTLTAQGTLLEESGVKKLKISGTNEVYTLAGDVSAVAIGTPVIVEGSIPEVTKEKPATTIEVTSTRADTEKK